MGSQSAINDPKMKEIKTISDLAKVPDYIFGSPHEFFERKDGFIDCHTLSFGFQTSVKSRLTGLMYKAIQEGS